MSALYSTLMHRLGNIPTFGIRIMESLEELDFCPDIKAKFPETPPCTYPTLIVNLTLSHAKNE